MDKIGRSTNTYTYEPLKPEGPITCLCDDLLVRIFQHVCWKPIYMRGFDSVSKRFNAILTGERWRVLRLVLNKIPMPLQTSLGIPSITEIEPMTSLAAMYNTADRILALLSDAPKKELFKLLTILDEESGGTDWVYPAWSQRFELLLNVYYNIQNSIWFSCTEQEAQCHSISYLIRNVHDGKTILSLIEKAPRRRRDDLAVRMIPYLVTSRRLKDAVRIAKRISNRQQRKVQRAWITREKAQLKCFT